MKVIVDAHLPRSICTFFEEIGCETLHTTDLEEGNKTSDAVIRSIATEYNAAVITKDQDFFHSFLLKREPPKLVMVKVGNMRLKEIKKLFEGQAKNILELLETYDLLELYEDKITAVE